MAQIRFEMGRDMTREVAEDLLGPEGALAQVVNEVHYGVEELNPGDITLAVTKTEGSSIAVISQGSKHWLRGKNGFYLLKDEMKTALAEMVQDIRERLGNLATGISFFEANGISPQSLPGMGRNTSPIIVVSGFDGAPLNPDMLSFGVRRAVSEALSYRQVPHPKTISFPEIIQELSGSSAGAEVEVILPCSQFQRNTEYLDKAAEQISTIVGEFLQVPTNTFLQAPLATGWYQAA